MGRRFKKKISICLKASLYDQLDAYCKKKELNRSECIETFLNLIFNVDGWIASVKTERKTEPYTIITKARLEELTVLAELASKIKVEART